MGTRTAPTHPRHGFFFSPLDIFTKLFSMLLFMLRINRNRNLQAQNDSLSAANRKTECTTSE